MPDEEVWRPVVGCEGSYEVSDQGRVRSVDRGNRPGRILTPEAQRRTGHLRVRVTGRIRRSVHHLALEAFIGPRPPGLLGLHANDNPADNRLENLRWGTAGDNGEDAVRNGAHPMAAKVHCPRGHLLAGPNLRPSGLRNGYRDCLACNRASCAARRHRWTPEQLQDDADRRYSLILSGEAIMVT